MSISQSVEDYLKTIYVLEEEGGRATTTNIAEALSVSSASVTNMLKRLAVLKLITHKSYRGAELTDAGKKIALEMIRHHRLLELYLKEMLGYSWDEVHDEAEKLEHVISEQFEDKIAELLNHPTVDPHGDPIPTKDGKMPKIKSRKLSSLEPGVECVVRRVKNQDSDILRKLERKGILPGVSLEVVSNDTDQEKLTLKVEGKKVELSHTLASQIRVF